MNLGRISVSALAAMAIMTSTISSANEIDIEKILKENETINNTNEKSDGDMEKVLRSKNATRYTGEVDKKFAIGETASITIPKYGYYTAEFETISKGILSLSIDIPSDLKTDNNFLSAYIYDESGDIVINEFFTPNKWKGQSKFILNTGLNKGKYKLEISTDYLGEIDTKLSINSTANNNVEVEPNDSTSEATPIQIGTTYKGSLTGYESDVYKINVPKDTRVRIKVKESKVINSNSKTRLYPITLSNSKKAYITNYNNGLAEKDLILKKGTNYIEIYNDSSLMDYSINVNEVVGPFKPDIDKVGDSHNFITGTTEIGTRVYVKVGSKAYVQANVNDKGHFNLKTGKVKKGTEVRVYAKNSKGVNSSVATTICVDTTPPNKPVLNKFTVDSTEVTGTAEANATLRCRINNDPKKVYDVPVNSKGKFSLPVGKLSRGTKIEAQAIDSADNYSPIAETRVQGYVAPPKVNNFSNINVTLTGTANKDHTVIVKVGSKTYSGKVDPKGKFSIKIPKQKYKTVLKVYAEARNGDTSEVVSVKVGYAPKKPTVNTISTNSTKVTGKTSKNATVTVKIGSKTYTGKSTTNGNFSIKIPKQKKGTKITVQAQFESTKFKSYSTSVTVK